MMDPHSPIVTGTPTSAQCLARAAQAQRDGDLAGALAAVRQAVVLEPRAIEPMLQIAQLLAVGAAGTDDAGWLSALATEAPAAIYIWLLLGRVRESRRESVPALQAYFQAVTRAQAGGLWLDEAGTPDDARDAVLRAIGQLRRGRAELYAHAYDGVRETYGRDEMRRVDRALAAHLKQIDAPPPSPHQQPRFFYFPDLPPGPYHDPWLHPWTRDLVDAFADLRREATQALAEDRQFDSFFSAGAKLENYLRADQGQPAWDALFFYRHGQRFDDNHARCPAMSRLLESIELCRIADEAPEICFSVLAPHTEILPHHGVTNVRLVMHLPLVVPPDCALSVDGGGEHHWREQQPMLFDDTYRHSAWNRSDRSRIIVLMDCWNPHLTPAERLAVRDLIETIGALGRPGARGTRPDH